MLDESLSRFFGIALTNSLQDGPMLDAPVLSHSRHQWMQGFAEMLVGYNPQRLLDQRHPLEQRVVASRPHQDVMESDIRLNDRFTTCQTLLKLADRLLYLVKFLLSDTMDGEADGANFHRRPGL